jgi:hypothetical protein
MSIWLFRRRIHHTSVWYLAELVTRVATGLEDRRIRRTVDQWHPISLSYITTFVGFRLASLALPCPLPPPALTFQLVCSPLLSFIPLLLAGPSSDMYFDLDQ